MLTQEENDLLTQTGPSTPGGALMRRYWLPAALSDEVPRGGPPLAVRLLGEDLVAFRDLEGRLGLLSRRCSHRGADLRYGEVEQRGIRCFYHGWLYDTLGHCLEQPLEPPESQFCEEIQHVAYSCQEKAGIVFAYLGPDEPPVLPAYEFLGVADDHRRAAKYLLECNYLQAAEGSVDPLQTLIFREVFERDPGAEPSFLGPRELSVEAESTEFGLRLYALRTAGQDQKTLEIRDFMLPALSTLSGVGIDGYTVHWHVPIDDTHHWRYLIAFRRDGPITDEEARRNGVEEAEGNRLVFDLKDREQGEVNFVAYAVALAESQGPIYDRTQEHLVNSDEGLITMRAVVHKAIQDVQEGSDPPHVIRDPSQNRFPQIAGREQLLPKDADWRAAVESAE